MKKFLKSKKGLALLATMVAAVATAVGAYAYFTATGQGSTTASVGTASDWLVEAGALTGELNPGQGSDQSTGTVTNQGDPNQKLHQIVATIEAPDVAEDAPAGDPLHACAASDFALSNSALPSASDYDAWVVALDGLSATLTINQDLEPTNTATWSGLDVSMLDNNYNQDNCQGATANVSFDAS